MHKALERVDHPVELIEYRGEITACLALETVSMPYRNWTNLSSRISAQISTPEREEVSPIPVSYPSVNLAATKRSQTRGKTP